MSNSPEERIAERLSKLEASFDALIAQDAPGSLNVGTGRIPFGSLTGVLKDDSGLIWDNTNKRLGVGEPTPAAFAHISFTGGTKIGLTIEQKTASGDSLLFLNNSTNDITAGDNFIVALRGATIMYQVGGDGRINTALEYRVSNTRVLNGRKTGWTLPTGTLSRATFDQSTVTLAQLAQRVAALITDLHNTAGHGLIGT